MSIPVTINQGSSVIKGRREIGPLCLLLPVSGRSIVFIKGTYILHVPSKRENSSFSLSITCQAASG